MSLHPQITDTHQSPRLQPFVRLAFAFYIFKALLGKMADEDWKMSFVVLMAMFVTAYVRSQVSFGG